MSASRMSFGLGTFVAVALISTFGSGCAAKTEDSTRLGQSSEKLCSSATLTGAASGATSIVYSATAGCAAGDGPVTYRFFRHDPGGSWNEVQSGTSNTYTFDATGAAAAATYDFQVWVRANGSSAEYESYASAQWVNSACTAASLTAPDGAALGDDVVLTAGATCPGGSPADFQFYRLDPGGSWTLAQDYGQGSTYTFHSSGLTSKGPYQFQAWARHVTATAAYEVYADKNYTLAPPAGSGTCTSVTAAPTPAKAVAGDPINIKATGVCDAPAEYQFYVLPPGGTWTLARDFGGAGGDTYAWPTTGLASGTYQWQIWARAVGTAAAYQAYYDIQTTIVAPCSATTFVSSPDGTASAGTPVTISSVATCPDGAPEYTFYMQAPGGSWTQVQPYGSSGTYNWTTTGLAAGSYNFQVWARTTGTAGQYEAYNGRTYTLTL